MTVISEPVSTIAGADNNTTFEFSSPYVRAAGDDLVTMRPVQLAAVDGVLTTPDLQPGPAVVRVGQRVYQVNIPDEDDPIRLTDLIAEYEPLPPAVVSQAWLAAQEAGEARDQAVAAAQGISDISDDVAQVEADKAAVAADRAAVETAASAVDADRVDAQAAATAAGGSATAAAGSAAAAASSAGDADADRIAAQTARTGAESAAAAADADRVAAESASTAASGSAAAAAASAEEAADVVGAGVPNATAVVKGGVLLPGGAPGELGGTWDHPTVTGWADKSDVGHNHPTSAITGLDTALSARELTANRGAANGYAPLDNNSKVPAANLPSYVDDVLEYANLAAFPATGETGKIYTDQATGKIHRWSGSAYVEISPSPGSTDSVTEGSTNKYYTDARVTTRVQAMFGTASGTVAQGNDSRFTDARTPTAAGQVFDIAFVAQAGTRATGAGNVLPQGIKLPRAARFSRVIYRGSTADASGNLVVELRKNGTQLTGSDKTIAAADQTAGGANATATGTWDFAEGDVLSVQVTAVGTTPGQYLSADIKGVTL